LSPSYTKATTLTVRREYARCNVSLSKIIEREAANGKTEANKVSLHGTFFLSKNTSKNTNNGITKAI